MLGKRLLFGFLGVCYLVLMFYAGGWFFYLSVVAFALIGTRELYTALMKKGFRPAVWTGYLSVTFFYVQHLVFNGQFDFALMILLILLILSLPVFFQALKPIDSAVTLLGVFYPGIILLFIVLLKEAQPYRHFLLILALFTTFSTDTFAYLVGRSFGKRKLIPAISPNKTVEGSMGGLVGSILVSLLVGYIFNRVYNIHIGVFHYVFIGLLSGILSQLGDLTASAMKRYCGIKDYGNVLPGHGGILDRFDSFLFTAPVLYIYYLLFLAL